MNRVIDIVGCVVVAAIIAATLNLVLIAHVSQENQEELRITSSGPVIITVSTNPVTRARLVEWISYHHEQELWHRRKHYAAVKMLSEFDKQHAVAQALYNATNVPVNPPPLPQNPRQANR